MKNTEIYKKFYTRLETDLELLPDKPEETVEATLIALWRMAYGQPMSVESAGKGKLPELDDDQVKLLGELVNRRLSGVPLAYITGRQQFMGVELIANSGALIPRKETEILGNQALQILNNRIEKVKPDSMVFDICCGAGNLAVALAVKSPGSKIYASDLSEEATELARENVRFHDLEDRITVYTGDLLTPFESDEFYGRVDMIVCNPPYISDFKVPKMAREISGYEPEMAFKGGGILGMNIVQNLVKSAGKFLREKGVLLVEIGLGQGDYVMNLCRKTGLYSQIISATDTNGNIRVVGAVK